jgi:hypothetical protein
MTKEKAVETCLVISTGLLVLYFVLHMKVFIPLAVLIGAIGIFIKPLAVLIATLWIKLGELMGFISSKIILTVAFFVFLLPIATLYRLIKKDALGLKNTKASYWTNRQVNFSPKDLDNIW